MPLVIVDATEDNIVETMRIDNEPYSTSGGSTFLFPTGQRGKVSKYKRNVCSSKPGKIQLFEI
jgi:hypothetical protein